MENEDGKLKNENLPEEVNTGKIPENTGIVRDEKGRIVAGSNSLNPTGKPKGTKHLSSLLKQALEDEKDITITQADGTKKTVTFAQALIHRLKTIALKGEDKDAIKAIAETFDRVEGKARGSMAIDITNEVREIKTTYVYKTLDEYNRDKDIEEEREEQDENND
jgi:hypothetical protein